MPVSPTLPQLIVHEGHMIVIASKRRRPSLTATRFRAANCVLSRK
jgi:hypothetical protein